MKQPSTSLEAYKSVTVEMKNTHYSKILKALKSLGSGTYEELANHIGMDRHQIGRRLKEMELEELIYKSGLKRPTKSGRNAFVYYLVGSSQPKTEKEINYAKVQTTAAEHASNIINKTKELTQPSLF